MRPPPFAVMTLLASCDNIKIDRNRIAKCNAELVSCVTAAADEAVESGQVGRGARPARPARAMRRVADAPNPLFG